VFREGLRKGEGYEVDHVSMPTQALVRDLKRRQGSRSQVRAKEGTQWGEKEIFQIRELSRQGTWTPLSDRGARLMEETCVIVGRGRETD